jgi:hypothetical protein
MLEISVGVIVAALIAKVLDRAEDGVLSGAWALVRRAFGALRSRAPDAGDGEAAAPAVSQTALGDGNVQIAGVSDSEVDVEARPDRGPRP